MLLTFNSIALQNFGSFADKHVFELNRGPGLFFITGKNNVETSLTTNGAGKSTLITSIYWALTGKTLRQQRPGSSVESWHSKGTVSVSLDLSIDDTVYVVTRTRRPNSLTVNNSIVDQSYVNKLIRLNEETLKRTIIVGQFVPLFLDLKSEQQSSLLSEALSLDVWLRASESANEQSRTLGTQTNKLELYKAKIEGRVAQLKLQYESEGQREKEYETNKRSRLAQSKIQIKELREQWSTATDAFQASYSAESDDPITDTDDAVIHAQRSRHGKCEALVRSIATELRIAQNSHASLERRLAKYQSSQNQCPECGQLVDSQHILTKTNELMFNLSQSSEILIKLDNDHTAASLALDEITADLNTLEQQYETTRTTYLQRQRERLKAENEVNRFQIAVTNAETDLINLQNEKNPYTAMCERLAQEFCVLAEQIEALEQEISTVIEAANTYRLWAVAYKEIRLNLIDETLTELQFTANRHVEALGLDNWRIEFHTERENKSGTITHAFTTLIIPSGQTNPVTFESYSGGESQRLQLAVTAGLSEILLSRAGIDTNIEIYDEPSKGLSREGISDLLECLKERASELRRSIYFVDHSSLDSGFFDSIIMVEKNPLGSRIIS